MLRGIVSGYVGEPSSPKLRHPTHAVTAATPNCDSVAFACSRTSTEFA